jgi:plasmid stability protein
MAQLVVRNIDERIAKRLKRKAAESGVSMEEAHRRILQQALSFGNTSFKEMLLAIPSVGRDEDFERIPQPVREIDL